jgi:hypothetical protein
VSQIDGQIRQSKFCSALFRRVLELPRGFFKFPFENIEPVVLGLYILIPLEKGLLEQLVLGFRLFCASDCCICLGTEGGEFLFNSKRNSASTPNYFLGVGRVGTWRMLYVV